MAEIASLLDPVVNHIKRGLHINLVIGANENTDALFRAIPEQQSNPGTDDGRAIDAILQRCWRPMAAIPWSYVRSASASRTSSRSLSRSSTSSERATSAQPRPGNGKPDGD
ncbi:hypothetical protein [Halochromatium roseum]|uniref:hypothetical protein n=1 Tax=Halochromatium roseum TaxID=391920 RepID=UPI001913ABD8|nr:hypothetical protein [Halochromatium roseum]